MNERFNEQPNIVGKFFTGLGIGVGIGIIVGLLIAPQSGKETRKAIASKAKDTKELVIKKVKDIKQVIKPTVDGTHK